MGPRVTIVMATYNRSNVLPYSIGSALLQTFGDFELLVVGDGCTDDTAAVVAAIDDPRVRFIGLPENSGHQSAPNNEGLRQARGAIVAYLGHDDLWLPHHLACVVSAIDGGADLAYCAALFIGPGDGRRALAPERAAYRRGDWIPPSTLAHRRASTDRVGGWRDHRTLVIDPEAELIARFSTGGLRIELVPRLSVLKFPAAWQKGVYRARPDDQQREWSERAAREPFLEQEELVKLGLSPRAGLTTRKLLGRAAAWVKGRLQAVPLVRRVLSGRSIERRRRRKGL